MSAETTEIGSGDFHCHAGLTKFTVAQDAHSRILPMQFLIEAVMLSVSGGLIGIAFGVGGAHTLSANFGWSTLVSLNSIGMALAFSVMIGVFFGFYPARKASRLDPIEALRYE